MNKIVLYLLGLVLIIIGISFGAGFLVYYGIPVPLSLTSIGGGIGLCGAGIILFLLGKYSKD